MSHPKLTELRKYLLNNLGLNFKIHQEKDLYRKLEDASGSFHFDNVIPFIDWLVNQQLSPEQTETLASFLTIGETYFCREKKALDYLEFEYLPELINKRKDNVKRLKIWSAGCATGEEPYSVAILLKRVIPDIKNWDIKILATDINAAFLKKARRGLYNKWSFRGNPDSFKKNHFQKTLKGKYQINSNIKRMVSFSYLNLAIDTYPSLINETNAIDIILCRNVLIYFSVDGIKTVTSNFYNSLIDGGVLLVSPVETSNLISSKFSSFTYNRVTIYNKDVEGNSRQKLHKIKKPVINVPLSFDIKPKKIKKRFVVKSDVIPEIKLPEKIPPKKKTIDHSEFKKAMELYKTGLFDEAESLIEGIAVSKNDDIKPYILLLARIKANKGQLDESEKLCLQAIEIDKVDAEAHYLHATVICEQGKLMEAINSLKKTLFLNHDFVLGHFLLGNISLNDGKKSESKKHFSNALKSLAKLNHSDIIAESDGLTAGRLSEIIHSMTT